MKKMLDAGVMKKWGFGSFNFKKDVTNSIFY